MVKAFQKGWTVQQYPAKVAKDHPLPPDLPPRKIPSCFASMPLFARAVVPGDPRATPIMRRILEIYFNAIEFVPTSTESDAAARHYFGKRPKTQSARSGVLFVDSCPNPKRRYIQYRPKVPDDGWEKYVERIVRRSYIAGADDRRICKPRWRVGWCSIGGKRCRKKNVSCWFSTFQNCHRWRAATTAAATGKSAEVIPPLPPWIEMHHGSCAGGAQRSTGRQ